MESSPILLQTLIEKYNSSSPSEQNNILKSYNSSNHQKNIIFDHYLSQEEIDFLLLLKFDFYFYIKPLKLTFSAFRYFLKKVKLRLFHYLKYIDTLPMLEYFLDAKILKFNETGNFNSFSIFRWLELITPEIQFNQVDFTNSTKINQAKKHLCQELFKKMLAYNDFNAITLIKKIMRELIDSRNILFLYDEIKPYFFLIYENHFKEYLQNFPLDINDDYISYRHWKLVSKILKKNQYFSTDYLFNLYQNQERYAKESELSVFNMQKYLRGLKNQKEIKEKIDAYLLKELNDHPDLNYLADGYILDICLDYGLENIKYEIIKEIKERLEKDENSVNNGVKINEFLAELEIAIMKVNLMISI